MNHQRPPANMRERGMARWYREHEVACEECGNRATNLWRGKNVCYHCMCPEPDAEYLAEERARCTGLRTHMQWCY